MVYVGTREYKFKNMRMSHMIADTIEELHAMADSLGISRDHFQDKPEKPHYDICKSKKKKAIRLLAKEVSDKEIVLILKQQNGIQE